MKRVAVLLDGAFVLHRLQAILRRPPAAHDVYGFACRCVRVDEEELFRVYFYQCPPFAGRERHPVSRITINFAQTPIFRTNQRLLEEIAQAPYVAVRAGELSFDGWTLTRTATEDLLRASRPLAVSDIKPDLKQKRVDMKIGLDVAWLASKRIVDRIILVAGDSDFVPAMKFARREGVQVILVPMQSRYVKSDLRVHADDVREIIYP